MSYYYAISFFIYLLVSSRSYNGLLIIMCLLIYQMILHKGQVLEKYNVIRSNEEITLT